MLKVNLEGELKELLSLEHARVPTCPTLQQLSSASQEGDLSAPHLQQAVLTS